MIRLGVAGDAAEATIPSKRCAEVAGYNVHANTGARANERARQEILVKCLARPPIAEDRLSELPDGRLALRFKQAWLECSVESRVRELRSPLRALDSTCALRAEAD